MIRMVIIDILKFLPYNNPIKKQANNLFLSSVLGVLSLLTLTTVGYGISRKFSDLKNEKIALENLKENSDTSEKIEMTSVEHSKKAREIVHIL